MDWPGGSWEATAAIVGVIAGIYAIIIYLSTLVWTYRDIQSRTRDAAAQLAALLLVGVFFLAGLVVYLILRPKETLTEAYERSLEEEALLAELQDQPSCPECRRAVGDDYVVCPHCAAQLREPCVACARPLSNSWIACPYCGIRRQTRRTGRALDAGPVSEQSEASAAPARFSELANDLDAALERAPQSDEEQPLELPRRTTRRRTSGSSG